MHNMEIADDGSNNQIPAIHVAVWIEFLAPNFCVASPLPATQLVSIWGMKQKMEVLSFK